MNIVKNFFGTEQRASDNSKPYVAEQYGVNFLVLDELARQLRQTITIVAVAATGHGPPGRAGGGGRD